MFNSFCLGFLRCFMNAFITFIVWYTLDVIVLDSPFPRHALRSPSSSSTSTAAVRACYSLCSVAARESRGLRQHPLHFVLFPLASREVCSQSLNLGPEKFVGCIRSDVFSSVTLNNLRLQSCDIPDTETCPPGRLVDNPLFYHRLLLTMRTANVSTLMHLSARCSSDFLFLFAALVSGVVR